MSKKKNKKKKSTAAAVVPTPAPETEVETVETEATEAETPVEEKKEPKNYAFWETQIYGRNSICVAIETDPEDPSKAVDLLDVRMEKFPNVRLSDLTEEEVSAILSRPVTETCCARVEKDSEALEMLEEWFQYKMDSYREIYGSIEAGIFRTTAYHDDTFRVEGVPA